MIAASTKVRIGVFVLICIATTGCQTTKETKISTTSAASLQLQGKVLAIATEFPSDLYAMKAKNIQAAAMPFGAGTDIALGNAEGKTVVQTYGVQDPALSIAQGLGERLISARGMQRLEGAPPAVVPGPPDVLLGFYPKADYVLVVTTTNWMYYYYSFDWSHYRVLYQAKFRLIEAATKRVVAESGCSSNQEDKKRPDIAELLANNAEILKAFLARAAADCTQKMAAAL